MFLTNTSTMDQTLGGMYNTCSMGNLQLDANSSLIYTVPFPCSGTLLDGSSFTTNTCDNNNVVQWQTYAAQWAANQGIALNRFQHRVILLPKAFHSVISGGFCDGEGWPTGWVLRWAGWRGIAWVCLAGEVVTTGPSCETHCAG